jgi:hypothetical protein
VPKSEVNQAVQLMPSAVSPHRFQLIHDTRRSVKAALRIPRAALTFRRSQPCVGPKPFFDYFRNRYLCRDGNHPQSQNCRLRYLGHAACCSLLCVWSQLYGCNFGTLDAVSHCLAFLSGFERRKYPVSRFHAVSRSVDTRQAGDEACLRMRRELDNACPLWIIISACRLWVRFTPTNRPP